MFKLILLTALLFLFVLNKAQSESSRSAGDSLLSEFVIPMFNTAGEDAETQLEQQDVSPLLQSSRDVFLQFSAFQFGTARYKMRGYSSRNQSVYINGVPVNDPENGVAGYNNWGGLNDVTRYAENKFGTTSCPFGFAGTGGFVNIESRAAASKKSTRFTISSTNRIYRNRIAFTQASGLSTKGWALTFSGSVRNGNETQVPGTFFRAAAFYLSVDKQITKKHQLSFSTFVAPLEQSRTSAATNETYELAGSNFYNPNWGTQNGKMRNANISRNLRPTILLSHSFNWNKTTRLNSSLYFHFGRSGNTSLNWNDSPNPKPDYYRYLPSFLYAQGDTAAGDNLKNYWEQQQGLQINWDQLIAMNQANLYTDPHVLGQGLNTSETRARYILENKIENLRNFSFSTAFQKRHKNWQLDVGLNVCIYKNRKYKVLEDLLGASFWIDVDQFAENLGVEESIQQNDIDQPNRKVRQGEKFGYDYAIRINKAESWAQVTYSSTRFEFFLGATFSGTQLWREGYVANGKFPNSSKGRSKTASFLNAGLKGGITYKISGRHFLVASALAMSRNPDLSASFVSPRVRNEMVKDLRNENIFSGELSYQVKYPALKFRLSVYSTQVNHQTWLRTYWHDGYNNNVNLIMRDLDQQYSGIECGFEKTIYTSHLIQGAFGFAQSVYNNRPVLEAWQDNNSAVLFSDRTTYLTNYRIGGSPQLAAGLGYKFNAKKFWYAAVYGNFFDQIFIEPNPDRRTAEAVGKYLDSELELAKTITVQEQLRAYFVVNANAGKSFRLRKKYMLNLNLSVNNMLNTLTAKATGFESLRWDENNVNTFPNKYYYMNGITYMLILTCSF